MCWKLDMLTMTSYFVYGLSVYVCIFIKWNKDQKSQLPERIFIKVGKTLTPVVIDILLVEIIKRKWWPVDLWTGHRQLEPPHPFSFPWNVCLALLSHSGSIFKNAALRKWCIVETIYIEYVTEPNYGHRIKF